MLILNFRITLKKLKEGKHAKQTQRMITNFINTVDVTCQKMILLNENKI